MKKLTLAAVIVFAAFLAAPLASEAGGRGGHGGHFHHAHGRSRVVVGFGVGPYWGPGWGYPYWGSPYWYYPPPAYTPVVVQEPPVYVQQPAPVAPAPAPAEQYWYYCESSRGYYPSVPNCPEQWLKVAPRP